MMMLIMQDVDDGVGMDAAIMNRSQASQASPCGVQQGLCRSESFAANHWMSCTWESLTASIALKIKSLS